jgi:son of sevenless-like protein
MKTWIESYCEDYTEDRKVLQEMKEFAATTMSDISFASNQIVKLAEKREGSVGPMRVMIQTSRDCPPPILPRNLKKMKFLDLDPLEIARQLTVLESKFFNLVEPVEFLKKAWSDKDSDISFNVKNVVKTSNLITSWVAQSVLVCRDIKVRASYIKQFIQVAEV